MHCTAALKRDYSAGGGGKKRKGKRSGQDAFKLAVFSIRLTTQSKMGLWRAKWALCIYLNAMVILSTVEIIVMLSVLTVLEMCLVLAVCCVFRILWICPKGTIPDFFVFLFCLQQGRDQKV